MSSATFVLCIGCILTVFTIIPVLVDGIRCAVCKTTDHGCQSGDVASTVCDPAFDKCYTSHVYVTNGGEGTQRGCTNQTFMANTCRNIRARTWSGIVCQSLCDWDGCNSAFGPSPRSPSLVRKRSLTLVDSGSPSWIAKLSPPLIRKRSALSSWKKPRSAITERLASSIRNWMR